MPAVSRRAFLQTSALASSWLVLPRRLHGASSLPPSERLQLAQIGVGGRGKPALAALSDHRFVAFCDVDEKRGWQEVMAEPMSRSVVEANPDARWFKDYRLMFEEMADQIDGVVVATPDHSHFPAAMAAIAHGKHVFVEKPLCRTIREVRQLHAAARKAGVVTQMGNQGRAGGGIRLTREWIQAGVIGSVHTVHTWTDRPRLPWFADPAFDPDADAGETPVPDTLDWDLWLGPTPARPYRPVFVPGLWRGFVEFGCGSLGDMGCHQLDAPFYALDLGAPTSIEAATRTVSPKSFPASCVITWKFPARSQMPPVELKWFDGGLLPPQPVPGFKFDEDGGCIFYGTDGILHVTTHAGSVQLLPESRMRELRSSLPPRTIPRVKGGAYQEWAAAIRSRGTCGSNFDYSAGLTELVLLGVAAQRAQAHLQWDPVEARFPNRPDANEFIGPGYEYRPGWNI